MRARFLFLALCACTPSFQSPSDVSDLRVLAVEADPPEAQYDPATFTVLDDVRVRVLAVDPYHDGPASMDSAICIPTDTHRCPSDPRASVRFPTVTRQGGTEFSAVVPASLIGFIAQAIGADKLAGLGGVRLMFGLSVTGADPNSPVFADKILLYSPAGAPPNHNPALTGLAVTIDGVPQSTAVPGQTLQLKQGQKYGLRPLLAPDAREEYDTVDLKGNPLHLKEDPAYSFFVSPGAELDRDGAAEPVDGIAPPDGLVRIDAFRPGQGTLWVVVRDGRGGESWIAIDWSSS